MERATAESKAAERSPPPVALDPLDSIESDRRTIAELVKAQRLYELFLERARGDERYSEAANRAKIRISDLREEITFIQAGIDEKLRARSVK